MDLLAILKVTEKCNISCKYCILPEGLSEKIMPLETLDITIKRLIDFADSKINLIFHGGEPLLAPKKYYEAALWYEREYNFKGIKINNSIQTNGLLLKPEIIEFFKSNDIKIGLSYDGPEEIHDGNRVSFNGKGTHNKVVEKIDLLKKCGMQNGIVTVLTKNSLGKEEEIYQALKKVTKSARLNIYIPSGQGRAELDRLYVTPSEASQMLIKFYNLWINDEEQFSLSPFNEIISSMIRGYSRVCESNLNLCTNTFSINPLGNVYVCGRLSGVDEIRGCDPL